MISIDPTYNGPTGCGHGGVSAGRFAELVDPAAASVRLAAPIPLATGLESTTTEDRAVEFRLGDQLIATVSPLGQPLDVAPFSRVEPGLVAAAEARSVFAVGRDHPYPLCFGCGNARADHDGLGLFAGPVDSDSDGAGSDTHSSDLFAVRWTPAGTGEVPPWLVWGALDCPTAAPAFGAVGPDNKVLTGTLAVEVRDTVTAGVEHQILSRLVDVDGRKVRTEGALVDPDGNNLAVVASTWIIVDADLEVAPPVSPAESP